MRERNQSKYVLKFSKSDFITCYKSALKKHIEVVHEEKKHKCNICCLFPAFCHMKYSATGAIETRDKRYKLLMYCHQYFFGGKYDLIQLHRQIIRQNDGISMRNSLKPSPPAFSI